MSRLVLVAVATVSLAGSGGAAAQPAGKPAGWVVKGAKKAFEIKPSRGFVDDAMTFDGAGGRLLFVNTDAGDLVTLEAVDTAKGASLARIDLSRAAPLPDEIHVVRGSEQVVVLYRTSPEADAPRGAVVIGGDGAVVRRFGPATDVAYTTYAGTPAVVTYSRATTSGRKGVRVRHTVEARAVATGKRLGKRVTLDADETGQVARLGFRIQYWRNGYTAVHGVKEGTWERKEDQRSPDKYAVYDVPARRFARVEAVANLVEHAEHTAIAREFRTSLFARVPRNRSGVVVHAGDDRRSVELVEPFHHYDPSSLAYQPAADGGLFFSLTIDPVHPDAVARKKAVPAWIDLYHVAPGATRARRLARLLGGKRGVRWRASAQYWAVLEKHVGFSRGGDSLTVYAFEPARAP